MVLDFAVCQRICFGTLERPFLEWEGSRLCICLSPEGCALRPVFSVSPFITNLSV